MLLIFGLGLLVLGGVLQYVATYRARKKLQNEGVNPFNMLGALSKSLGDFADSQTPSEAIKSGLDGMEKAFGQLSETQRELNRKLRLENFLSRTGKVLVGAGAALLIVKIAIIIFN